MIAFRPMQKNDVPRIAELERICFRSPWSESSLYGELRNSIAHYRVGEEDGHVIAYGGMWVMFGEAHITNVAVDPEYRGRGYGKLLMLELISTALLHHADSMTLEVRISNTIAQSLYASLGFEVAGRRKRDYMDTKKLLLLQLTINYMDTGEDGLIMWNRHLKKTAAVHS